MAPMAPLPPDEDKRLEDLYRLHLLDTVPEERFDHLVQLVKQTFHVPIAMISLVDKDRQWFKSCLGVPLSETSREVSFCAYTILRNEALIVPDARQDPRFADNPFVQGSPAIRFYAGFPLRGPRDYNIGTLCISDFVPRYLNEQEGWMLKKFARVVQLEVNTALTSLSVKNPCLVNSCNKSGSLETRQTGSQRVE